MQELKVKAALQIGKPPREVFDAVTDPKKMSGYFIEESTGKMEEGKVLEWKFPEFEEWAAVKVVEINPDEYISFQWEGAGGKLLLVEFTFLEMPGNTTLLKITEGDMENNEEGIRWFGQNTEGWANFLACLKAYLEHGINLRKGGFDFMKQRKNND